MFRKPELLLKQARELSRLTVALLKVWIELLLCFYVKQLQRAIQGEKGTEERETRIYQPLIIHSECGPCC